MSTPQRVNGLQERRTTALASVAAPSGEAATAAPSPLEHMLAIMRDPGADEKRRDDMAKAAAPYLHARLAPVDPAGRQQRVAVTVVDCCAACDPSPAIGTARRAPDQSGHEPSADHTRL